MQNHIAMEDSQVGGIEPQQMSFKQFVFGSRRYRTILWVSAALIVIQFGVFKYFYPFAGFIHGDSFNYLNSAYENFGINKYMVGYAKFLRLFSIISTSDTSLVAFQYLFIQASGLFLVLSIAYFFRLGKVIQLILFIFIVLNPLFLYISNYISSDAFFLALSLTWLSLLIWVINRPSKRILLWHLIILFITFTVRYNALIYPVLAIFTFLISDLTRRQKIKGIALNVLFVTTFITYTSFKYKMLTGVWQYSPFSGWQLANNAMYAYRYVDSACRKPVPQQYKTLDNTIRAYFDSSRDIRKHPVEVLKASTIYMWDANISPLYKYRDKIYPKDSPSSDFKTWACMGPLYKDYGLYIIKQYPVYFLKYFVWPNVNKYYAPPVEFLASYNSGRDSTAKVAQYWFRYKSNKLPIRVKDRTVNLLNFYPILSGITNMLMLFMILFFIIARDKSTTPHFNKSVWIGVSIWALNALFTIFASSAALRFQSFPLILAFIYMFILIDWSIKYAIRQSILEKTVKSAISDGLKELVIK